MEPAAITFQVASLVIHLLVPLAVVAVAILVLRPRRLHGWMLVASGGGVLFLVAGGVPIINYVLTVTASRMGTEAIHRSLTVTAGVGLMGAVVHALGMACVVVGILRIAGRRKSAS
jgi:hypothetical protein